MTGILATLVENSKKAIDDNIYRIDEHLTKSSQNILEIIQSSDHPVLITEIKFASPSRGTLRQSQDPTEIAKLMIQGGASAISVLTQPHLFNGSPEYFIKVRQAVNAPLLMKDIIINKIQIDAAHKMGADIILLIQGIFDSNLVSGQDDLINYAHSLGLLVLLEVHTEQELNRASKTGTDLIGINNRNLDNMLIDLNTSCKLLKNFEKSCPIISESGIESSSDILQLRQCGSDAFLVGSSIMISNDIQASVERLVKSF